MPTKQPYQTPHFWLAFAGGVVVYILGELRTQIPSMGLPSWAALLAPILGVLVNWLQAKFALTQDPTALGIKAAQTPLPKPPSALNG